MTIEVTGCHDCPFAEIDHEVGLGYWCNHFDIGSLLNIDKYATSKMLYPSCPLKQETITIKLKENDKEKVLHS